VFSFENRGEWGGFLKTSIAVPDNSTATLSASTKASNTVLINTQGFITPPTLLEADATTGQARSVKALPARFNAANATVEQFTATSRDGTRIPYFVTRPKVLPASGAPTLLFGYGGFAVAKPPVYIAEMGKLWLENGGVYVNANIRGGGEFGPAWHQSVLKANRQGAFDDFTAVAQDLIRRGITSPDKLGIYGRSNGGVLTSVSITQHPELFDAAVIESPLVDMLRYHELPAGASWIGEYGDPRIPEEAAYIARYSAYQNIPKGKRLPEPYITTNTRDDRVHPGHARKFAARLQAEGHSALYFENTEGGHSNDSDPVMNAERWARHYVYLSRKLMDQR
jgi:prolyl oligopeptidase